MQRPLGVTILAVLSLIGGVLALLGAMASFFGSAVVNNPAMQGAMQNAVQNAARSGQQVPANAAALAGSAGPALMILGVFLLVNALLSFAFGVGALQLKPWAWTLGIASQGLSILISMWQLVSSGLNGGTLFGLLIAAGILFYLFQPSVRAAFGQDQTAL